MLGKMEKLLRGSVTFRVETLYPERVLNICAAQHIAFWNVLWLSETVLTLTVHRAERRRFRAAMGQLGASVTLERAAGAPYFAARFRRRYALTAGFLLLFALLTVNSLCIREFSVSGNETVRTEVILRALEEVGVRRGTFALSFRPKDICNRVLLKIPELSWLTVNVRGSCAYVSVRERVPKPEIVNERAPSNVISRRAALVTEVRALDGEAKVIKGMTVLPGQLLISGAVDTTATPNPTVGTRFLAGRGEVYGRTWHEVGIKLPLSMRARGEVREKKYALRVIFGEKELKIGAKGSRNLGGDCDKMIFVRKWAPISGVAIEVETGVFYAPSEIPREREQLRQEGEEILREYLRSQIDGEITRERFAAAEDDGWLLVTLSAECLEQIGKTVPIAMQE